MIYLDNAATSLKRPPQVERAILESLHSIGNAGRGAHAPTLQAARLLYRVREKLAELFGAPDPSRIAFAANATMALNEAVDSLIGCGDRVITTVCEHNSVLRPLYRKQAEGTNLIILSADEKGAVDPEILRSSLAKKTKAVVMHHAANVTGNVNDLAEIAKIVHEAGALLIVDAAQSAGSIPIDVQQMEIDVLCFTGHKGLMGPQGTGGIYVREGLQPRPFMAGGSGVHSFMKEHPADMPTVWEAGTANGHGLAGLEAALDYILETGVETIHRKESNLTSLFYEKVRDLPGVTVYGDFEANRHGPIVSLNIGRMDSALAADILWDEYEICVRAGAHCAPLIHQHFNTESQGMIRFSFSSMNTEEEVKTAAEAVKDLAES